MAKGGCVVKGLCEVKGACMAGGWGSGASVAGETATAADGTHRTGMHSCWNSVFFLARHIP